MFRHLETLFPPCEFGDDRRLHGGRVELDTGDPRGGGGGKFLSQALDIADGVTSGRGNTLLGRG